MFEKGAYQTGPMDCCAEPMICCRSCFLPCCTTGQLIGEMEGTGFNVLSCLCIGHAGYRGRMHIKKLQGERSQETGNEMFIDSLFCAPCGLAQQVREWNYLKEHGAIPSEEPVAVEIPESV